MPTGYCSIADCARILSTKVKFSNALSALGPDSKNVGNILLASSGILMNNAYYGKNIRFELRFANAGDLTQYQVWKQASSDGPKNMVFIGLGSTVGVPSVFAGYFTINAAGWSGAAVINDLIILITDSNMSVDDAEAIINDIEAQVDDVLRQEAIIVTPEGTIPTDLYFVVNAPVPRQIKVAVSYAFCYRAINDLFKAGRSLKLPSGKEEMTDDDFALAYQWAKTSEKALRDYIKTHLIQNAGNAPKWTGWLPLQSTIGLKGELYGEVLMGTDEDYTDEDNMLDTAGKIEDNLGAANLIEI